MQIEQVQQLKAKLKAEYEADDAAIERVLALLDKQDGKAISPSNGESADTGTVETKVLGNAALDCCIKS